MRVLAVITFCVTLIMFSTPVMGDEECAWSVVQPHLKNLPEYSVTAKRVNERGLLLILSREKSPKHLLIALHKVGDLLVTYQMARDIEGGSVPMDQELSDQLTRFFDALGNDKAVDSCPKLKLSEQVESSKAYDDLIALFNETFGLLEQGVAPSTTGVSDYILAFAAVLIIALVAVFIWVIKRRKHIGSPAPLTDDKPAQGQQEEG